MLKKSIVSIFLMASSQLMSEDSIVIADTLDLLTFYESHSADLAREKTNAKEKIQVLTSIIHEDSPNLNEYDLALKTLSERVDSEFQQLELATQSLEKQLLEAYALSDDLQLIVEDLYESMVEKDSEVLALQQTSLNDQHAQEIEKLNAELAQATQKLETYIATALAYENLIDEHLLQINALEASYLMERNERLQLQVSLENAFNNHSKEIDELKHAHMQASIASNTPKESMVDEVVPDSNISALMRIHQELIATALAYESLLDASQLKINDLEQLLVQASEHELNQKLSNSEKNGDELTGLRESIEAKELAILELELTLLAATTRIEHLQHTKMTLSDQTSPSIDHQYLNEVLEIALSLNESEFHGNHGHINQMVAQLQKEIEQNETTISLLKLQHESVLLTTIEEIAALQKINNQLQEAFTEATILLTLASETPVETNITESDKNENDELDAKIHQLLTQAQADAALINTLTSKIDNHTHHELTRQRKENELEHTLYTMTELATHQDSDLAALKEAYKQSQASNQQLAFENLALKERLNRYEAAIAERPKKASHTSYNTPRKKTVSLPAQDHLLSQ